MTTIAVIGLGYVGLPLAVEFGKKYRTIGFDLSEEKVRSYRRHVDPTGSVWFNLATAYLANKQTKKARTAARRFGTSPRRCGRCETTASTSCAV